MILHLLDGGRIQIPAKAVKVGTRLPKGCEIEYVDSGEVKTVQVYEVFSRVSALMQEELK